MNPFLFDGPGLVSLSGGETSARLLHLVLEAHAGRLPPWVHVTFANTGKEREETLRFVHEIGSRWDVNVRWLEWRGGEYGGVVEVGYNSASRNGEPFEELIISKQALPNWQARWCTGFLKVRAMMAFMDQQGLAPGSYVEMIGFRADETGRIADMVERNAKDGRRCTAPLGKVGITKRDVKAFWAAQPFQLALRDGEGNCDLCFLKGRGLKKALISERPSCAKQWIGWERNTGNTFDRRDSVEALAHEVRRQPMLYDTIEAADFDHECGLLECGPAALT